MSVLRSADGLEAVMRPSDRTAAEISRKFRIRFIMFIMGLVISLHKANDFISENLVIFDRLCRVRDKMIPDCKYHEPIIKANERKRIAFEEGNS